MCPAKKRDEFCKEHHKSTHTNSAHIKQLKLNKSDTSAECYFKSLFKYTKLRNSQF